jgi:hypothetical protein
MVMVDDENSDVVANAAEQKVIRVIAESVPKRTLSAIEERRAQISQGRTLCLSGSDGQT